MGNTISEETNFAYSNGGHIPPEYSSGSYFTDHGNASSNSITHNKNGNSSNPSSGNVSRNKKSHSLSDEAIPKKAHDLDISLLKPKIKRVSMLNDQDQDTHMMFHDDEIPENIQLPSQINNHDRHYSYNRYDHTITSHNGARHHGTNHVYGSIDSTADPESGVIPVNSRLHYSPSDNDNPDLGLSNKLGSFTFIENIQEKEASSSSPGNSTKSSYSSGCESCQRYQSDHGYQQSCNQTLTVHGEQDKEILDDKDDDEDLNERNIFNNPLEVYGKHRNISAVFFSDDANDANVEKIYNEVPLPITSSASSSTTGECEAYFGGDSDSGSSDCPKSNIAEASSSNQESASTTTSETLHSHAMNSADNGNNYLSMSTSSLTGLNAEDNHHHHSYEQFNGEDDESSKKADEYTTEIPYYYLPDRLNYPVMSPYQYSDREFDKLNHFDFLRSLNFAEPPLLPPYLNSNLLNDSATHNYKAYPYQYQMSNHIYINDQYRYNINDLNLMDKYSRQPPHSKLLRKQLKKRAPNSGSNGSIGPSMKHSDYIQSAEHYDVPNHVMLNHLITCNLKMDNVMTGSCIHRYSGKFITQIVYFPMEV